MLGTALNMNVWSSGPGEQQWETPRVLGSEGNLGCQYSGAVYLFETRSLIVLDLHQLASKLQGSPTSASNLAAAGITSKYATCGFLHGDFTQVLTLL